MEGRRSLQSNQRYSIFRNELFDNIEIREEPKEKRIEFISPEFRQEQDARMSSGARSSRTKRKIFSEPK